MLQFLHVLFKIKHYNRDNTESIFFLEQSRETFANVSQMFRSRSQNVFRFDH